MKRPSSLLGALIAPLLTLHAQAQAAATPSPEPAAPAVSAPAAQAPAADEDIFVLLRRNIPSMSFAELPSRIPGTRFFVMVMPMLADPQHPEGPWLNVKMTLLHRSTAAPMVLATTGYDISSNESQRELTYLLQGNQLSFSHRFFGYPLYPTSTPISSELLNIRLAAEDHHRLIQAFKAVYGGKWVTTGASKGGMASVYHRYFYPDDVDATVPYVAPSSKGPADARYVGFVAHAGNAPGCNEALRTFQRTALLRRDELLPRVQALPGTSFGVLGTERAFEFSVVELPHAFWQYGNASLCPSIPTPDAPADALFSFLESINPVEGFGDATLNYYAPYFFQAATELGAPRYDERHLHGLLRFPREDRPALYPPLGVEKTFDHSAMPQVERWVRTDGQRMLFVYGENDPWSTGAFEVRERNDSFRFFVPGGNHGSSILQLPEPQRSFALDKLEQWVGTPVLRPAAGATLQAEGGELPIDPPSREELFLR